MALPNYTDITTLSYIKNGEPWCSVPARSDIITTQMSYLKNGEPWVVNLYGIAPLAIGGPVFVYTV